MLAPRACAPSSAPSARPPPAGRSVRLRPSEIDVQPAHHAPAAPAAAGRGARSPRPAPAGRRSSPPISRSARNARERRIELERRGPRPRSDRVAKSSSRRSWPAGRLVEPLVAAGRTARRWPGGHRPAPGSSRSRSRSRLARLSRSLAARELVRQRRHQPAAVALEAAEQPAHAAAGDLDAEVAGRDVLEVMRLVEHQPLVGRQHRRLLPVVLGLPHREVGGEQVMVHHHDVGLRRPPAGAEEEAAVEVRALEPGAEVRLGAHLVPDLRRSASTGRSLSVPSAVWPAHSAMPISSSSLSGSSSVRCAPTAWCSRARQR